MLKQGMSEQINEYCVQAAKFMLPDGGFLIEDASLRAIDESIELHLPFPVIALEFASKHNGTKEVIFCTENETSINAFICQYHFDKWFDMQAYFYMPKTGYIDRTINGYCGYPGLISFDVYENEHHQVDPDDSLYWQRVLLSFLNALSCSNVHIAKKEPKKTGKKVKTALPFDTYHVLTIDAQSRTGESGKPTGSHRSPREHLRRGHIRKLVSGKKIWVNAAVVAAGRGAGIVKKDYALRMAA